MKGIMKAGMRQQKRTIQVFGPVLRLPNTGSSGDIRSGKAEKLNHKEELLAGIGLRQ